MELEEKAEELLEALWVRTEEKQETAVSWEDIGTPQEVADQLLRDGYITLADSGLRLTDKGRPEAMNVVRRHRLAERLLADVLGTTEMLTHEKACKFEHILDRGLDESICILLGHPKICPHGTPIPPGKCCRQEMRQAQKLVTPLSQMATGQKGNVAYIYAPQSNQLQKLMAMGILPGAPISLVQKFPTYVFQGGQTQFAVDKDIADAIYIRLIKDESKSQEDKKPRGRRRRWRQGFGLFRKH